MYCKALGRQNKHVANNALNLGDLVVCVESYLTDHQFNDSTLGFKRRIGQVAIRNPYLGDPGYHFLLPCLDFIRCYEM